MTKLNVGAKGDSTVKALMSSGSRTVFTGNILAHDEAGRMIGVTNVCVGIDQARHKHFAGGVCAAIERPFRLLGADLANPAVLNDHKAVGQHIVVRVNGDDEGIGNQGRLWCRLSANGRYLSFVKPLPKPPVCRWP